MPETLRSVNRILTECICIRKSETLGILADGPHGFGMAAEFDNETAKQWPMQALRFMIRQGFVPAEP